MKICKRCNEQKPFTEFYKHTAMTDGFLNFCKVCKRAEATAHRDSKLEEIRANDRLRGSRQSKEDLIKYRANNPLKYAAHTKVTNCIRDGKLFKENCEICGSTNTHAHHDNYTKPLDVRWLCPVHHHEWHKHNGEGLTA